MIFSGTAAAAATQLWKVRHVLTLNSCYNSTHAKQLLSICNIFRRVPSPLAQFSAADPCLLCRADTSPGDSQSEGNFMAQKLRLSQTSV